MIEVLGWTPTDQQLQVIDAYRLSLRKQHERLEFQAGEVEEEDLEYYVPGETIVFEFRFEAGHGIGKTKLAAGLISHFFDSFSPVVGYAYAPTKDQLRDLLFKEIFDDREHKNLPGRMLKGALALIRSTKHFFRGRAFDDAKGRGKEKIHGQHGPYSIYVFEEAEGIPKYVFDAVRTMTGGGVRIVLYYGNPRSRRSEFYRIRTRETVANFRFSTLNNPNVRAGREIVPGMQTREWCRTMIREHCDEVEEHAPDDWTFEVDWYLNEDGLSPILRPDDDFLYQVLGIPPLQSADRTLIPYGRYDAATRRKTYDRSKKTATIGVDVARFGSDKGKVYVQHGGKVWLAATLYHAETFDYVDAIEAAVEALPSVVESVSIRIDAGGGFAGGVVDVLKRSTVLDEAVKEWEIFEVLFNASPYEPEKYLNLITELYADAAEALRGLSLERVPNELEPDLCDRTFDYKRVKQFTPKKLSEKEQYRKEFGHSPDDGDGFVLCVAARYLLEGQRHYSNLRRRRGRTGAER